jgi:hypothetical protein
MESEASKVAPNTFLKELVKKPKSRQSHEATQLRFTGQP